MIDLKIGDKRSSNSCIDFVNRSLFITLMDSISMQQEGWFCVSVFIPTEWIHERKLTNSDVEQLLSTAEEFLFQMDGVGIFSRIGWTSYFLLFKPSETDDLQYCMESKLRSGKGNSDLWRCYLAEVQISGANIMNTFSVIETEGYKHARSERYHNQQK